MAYDWLSKWPKTFYSHAFKKHVDQWAKCTEKQGDCIGKSHICIFQKMNKKYLGNKYGNFLDPSCILHHAVYLVCFDIAEEQHKLD